MNIPFDSILHLLHGAAAGSLATQSLQMPGYPFASVLPFVLDERHRPVFLISRLAEHTKNLLADGRACLLVHGGDGQSVLQDERASVLGDVLRIEASPALVARYLRYHPDGERYLALGDFMFFRMEPKGARFIAGFGKMGWIEQSEWMGAPVLALEDEAGLIVALGNLGQADLRVLGVDQHGADIERAGRRERLRFADAPVAPDRLAEAVKQSASTDS
jgi:heme iron utilization protein